MVSYINGLNDPIIPLKTKIIALKAIRDILQDNVLGMCCLFEEYYTFFLLEIINQ